MTEVDSRLNRLSFRAWRRGFREADLILGPFVDQVGPRLNDDEIEELDRLLNIDDQYLYGWVIAREAPPSEHDTPLMARIQAFARAHTADIAARGAG